MASTKQPPKSRKLPPRWEKRMDHSTNKPYYVDHNTRTSHWHPPPPESSLPKTPPNNLVNKQPINPSSHLAKLDLNNTNNTNKPSRKRKKKHGKHPRHGRANTFGSSTTLQWNMDHELANIHNICNELEPISDNKPSKSYNNIPSFGLVRKPSKPYSKDDNTYHQRKMSKPMAPPTHLKKHPSLRNILSIKPPPMYTKKNIPSNPIPPPPPRSIPNPPSNNVMSIVHRFENTNIVNNMPPIPRAYSIKTGGNVPYKPQTTTPPAAQAPHRGALPTAGKITPTKVQRMTNINTFPSTEPVMQSNNSNSNSYDNNDNTFENAPKSMNNIDRFRRSSKINNSQSNSYILSQINTTPKTPELKTREHARTMTTPVLMNKWGNKSPHLSTVKFGKYKHRLAKKYEKNKNKLKEKYKEKKSVIKQEIKHYKKKRKKSNNFDVNNTSDDDDYSGFEYSISHTIESSIMNNPLSPNNNYQIDVKFDDDDDDDEYDKEDVKKAPQFYNLPGIVELVTAPKVRGTQDQTVLLHTYCLYSSRQELLEVIFSRLSAASEDKQAQIKVLSLLRTWLKTENDFNNVFDDNFKKKTPQKSIALHPITATIGNTNSKPNSTIQVPTGNLSVNLSDLSPTPSVPDPALTKMEQNSSLAHIQDNINNNIINESEEIDIFNMDTQPQFLKRHRIEYPEDYTFQLSPFATYFRQELIGNTQNNSLLTKLAQPILNQLSNDKRDSSNIRDRTLSFADAPTPKIPKVKNTKDLDLNKISPIEAARQICLLEYNIFKSIKPEEFLKQKSTKQKKLEQEIKSKDTITNNSSHNLSEDVLTKELKDLQKEKDNRLQKQSTQPNIDTMTDWFNRLVVWTQIEILYERDQTKRSKVLINILKICESLEQYNNISSLCAIRAGLCSAPIHRLRKTWDNISKKAKGIKANIDELFKLGNGQKNLRDRVAIISQPAIPHLGLFLGDIVFIHDGNETWKKDEMDGKDKINWSKMKLLADRINWISMFQQSPFIFETVPIIHEYLESKMKILPEDFLYKLSREVEPPEKKK